MIHTTTMIFMLKNMGALEIKTAREVVVAPEVECMVVWVDHPTWAEVDDLGLVLVETWVLDPVVVLGEEWGKKMYNLVYLKLMQLLRKEAHIMYYLRAIFGRGGQDFTCPVFPSSVKYPVWH
jgi:hypothetical protein